MTLFALPGKWLFFGANGLTAGAAALLSLRSEVNAIDPRARAHWPKKWRRVCNSRLNWFRAIGSLQHVRAQQLGHVPSNTVTATDHMNRLLRPRQFRGRQHVLARWRQGADCGSLSVADTSVAGRPTLHLG